MMWRSGRMSFSFLLVMPGGGRASQPASVFFPYPKSMMVYFTSCAPLQKQWESQSLCCVVVLLVCALQPVQKLLLPYYTPHLRFCKLFRSKKSRLVRGVHRVGWQKQAGIFKNERIKKAICTKRTEATLRAGSARRHFLLRARTRAARLLCGPFIDAHTLSSRKQAVKSKNTLLPCRISKTLNKNARVLLRKIKS